MKIEKFVDDIVNDPKKALVWGILIILAVVVLYIVWDKLKSIFSSISSSVSNVVNNPVESNNLTQADSWYSSAADSIFNAMNGYGTDYDTIISLVTTLQNQDDWNQLKRKYGTRTLEHFLYDDLTGGLVEHLRSELDSYEKQNINFHLNQRKINERI